MVIVHGQSTLVPWEARCRKFRLLFNMTKSTDKPLFAAGVGMQLLAHYCAVGMEQIKVINGKEKGGPISDLKH